MANSDFIFFVDVQDDLLYLKDLTDYPMTINEAERVRDDFGIAFAYTFGDWDTDTILVDIDNFMDITQIASSVGGIMRIRVFIVANWDDSFSYSTGEITFYENKFYKSLADSNGEVPTTVNWEELAKETAYTDLRAAFTSVDFDNEFASVDLICEVPYSPYFTVLRTDNYDYTLRNNFEDVVIPTAINLYNYENTLIEEFTDVFTLAADGVYKIVIDFTLNGVEEQQIIIVDNFYSFEVCARKMIETLVCEGTDCGDNVVTRDKINEFSNVYFAIFMNLNIEKIKFYGVELDGTEQSEYIQDVGLLIEKAKLLVEQCKACQDD